VGVRVFFLDKQARENRHRPVYQNKTGEKKKKQTGLDRPADESGVWVQHAALCPVCAVSLRSLMSSPDLSWPPLHTLCVCVYVCVCVCVCVCVRALRLRG